MESWILGLADNVLANLIASGASALLMIVIGVRGSGDKGVGQLVGNSDGQIIYSLNNSGIIQASYNSSNTTINHYGYQANRKGGDGWGIFPVTIVVIFLFGALIYSTRLFSVVQSIIVSSSIVVLLLSAIFLLLRKSYYTTVAKRRAWLSWSTLFVVVFFLNLSVENFQNLSNPHSLSSLAQLVDVGVGWMLRGLHLCLSGGCIYFLMEMTLSVRLLLWDFCLLFCSYILPYFGIKPIWRPPFSGK